MDGLGAAIAVMPIEHARIAERTIAIFFFMSIIPLSYSVCGFFISTAGCPSANTIFRLSKTALWRYFIIKDLKYQFVQSRVVLVKFLKNFSHLHMPFHRIYVILVKTIG